MPLLLNGIGNFLGYVAALFVTSVCWLLSLRGLVDSARNSKSLNCNRSQIRILHIAEFLLIGGSFLLFLISLDKAAFCVLASVCDAQLRLCKFCTKWEVNLEKYAHHPCNNLDTL